MPDNVALDAKGAMLQRIRLALRHTPGRGEAEARWDDLPRSYRQHAAHTREEVLHLLEDRLRDYDSGVYPCADSEVAATVDRILLDRQSPRMLVPHGFPPHWLPAESTTVTDTGWSPGELDCFDGILTGATLAIAETGTLVLQTGAGQGRRAANLVPDYHLCVVRAQDVVATVPEAVQWLAGTQCLPTTFVSGPSATADIEMTRIKGVHGPRSLDVVVVS